MFEFLFKLVLLFDVLFELANLLCYHFVVAFLSFQLYSYCFKLSSFFVVIC